jgi:glycosyltransferase involved in cell wall biosynthesis
VGEERKRHSVMIVAPELPPYGGMALQAQLLVKLLRTDGHPVEFFPSNFRLSGPFGKIPGVRTVVRYVLTWWKLWRQVAAVDIVHVLAASWLYFFAVVAPATIVGRIRGKRVILNYRGGDAARFFEPWGWAVKPIFGMADLITAPSRFLKELIEARFGIGVEVVNNIVDTSAFSYRERTAVRPRLIVARQLEAIYDIESVLRAFGAIRQRYPEACLAVAGAGSQGESLVRMAAEWGLNVEFLGHVAHDDLPAVFDRYDIFLNASRIDNFPGALIEASAAGLLVVSTAAGGIRFMYENEKDALLVEPGDWEALARSVERAVEAPQLARQCMRAALDMVRLCEWPAVRDSIYRSYAWDTARHVQQVTVSEV